MPLLRIFDFFIGLKKILFNFFIDLHMQHSYTLYIRLNRQNICFFCAFSFSQFQTEYVF